MASPASRARARPRCGYCLCMWTIPKIGHSETPSNLLFEKARSVFVSVFVVLVIPVIRWKVCKGELSVTGCGFLLLTLTVRIVVPLYLFTPSTEHCEEVISVDIV